MANPGTGSAQGNELEQAGSFDASGQKIWINRATNDFLQMASGQMTLFIGGVSQGVFSSNSVSFSSSTAIISGRMQAFSGEAGVNASGFFVSYGNGGSATLNGTNITLTTNSGIATQTWAAPIPAGSILLGYTAFVSTAITGCTSWSIGYTGQASAFGSALSVNQGTKANFSTAGAGFTGPTMMATAKDVILTAAGGGVVFTTGAVRIGLSVLTITDFTS